MRPAVTMDEAAEEAAESAKRPAWARPGVLAIGLVAALAVLALMAMASVALGARSVPFATVIDAFLAPDGSNDHTVIRELRVPRTLLGLGVGATLGLAGALMQSLTRNPSPTPGCWASTRARRWASRWRSACSGSAIPPSTCGSRSAGPRWPP